MKLIVGLGNPDAKYARNRHNVGFMAVERIVDRHGLSAWRKRFQGRTSEGEIAGEKVIALEPMTYMNESGRAVGEAARFLKIDPADVIVFHDELDLFPGKVKVKTGGGNAGHNGLRSITAHIGNEYVRVRIGIGHPGHKDLVHHWVLQDFIKSDADWLNPLLDAMADAAPRIVKGDQSRFLGELTRALSATSDDEEPATVEPPKRDAKPAANHPAGERANKRQGALARNLEKWLSSRKHKQD